MRPSPELCRVVTGDLLNNESFVELSDLQGLDTMVHSTGGAASVLTKFCTAYLVRGTGLVSKALEALVSASTVRGERDLYLCWHLINPRQAQAPMMRDEPAWL